MYEFVVDGMKCGGCVGGVTRAVKAVDPDAIVRVDQGAKKVQVDSESEESRVLEAIQAAGYGIKNAKAERGSGRI